MVVIKSIKECPQRQNELVEYVKEQWPKVQKVVLPKIDESLSSENGLPFTFLLLKYDKIIGFYQLIEQEFVTRKDLSPWIAPLFIDKNERGQALGSVLLEHARKIAGQLGYKKVYLATDHILYYEKYGFREIGLDNFEWGRPTKIYEHDTVVYIETDRLIVRIFGESDYEQFNKLLDMPEYGGWQKQKPRAKDFFNWHLSNYVKMDIVTGAICLGIFEKETGDIVGQVAAQKHDDLNEPEFGYGILPFARGKGYAKEAARATLEWIEKRYDIPYIIGTVEVDNIPSQKVLEYCGFKLIDERNLLVHIMDERHDFKYYRYHLKK